MSRTTISERRRGERGFTLAAVIVILTVIMVIVAYTVPRQWSRVMQRDRDYQTVYAMKQYARAIMAWQKAHGGLPVSLQQLKEARSPRFMRGVKAELPDPLTGQMDWILVPPAENGLQQAPQPKGGPPLTDTTKTDTAQQNKPAANKDYVGPFVGVRPPKTGKAYIMLNGQENYEDWRYNVQDLVTEQTQRALALGQFK